MGLGGLLADGTYQGAQCLETQCLETQCLGTPEICTTHAPHPKQHGKPGARTARAQRALRLQAPSHMVAGAARARSARAQRDLPLR